MKKNIKVISISLLILVVAGIIFIPKIFSGKEKDQEPSGKNNTQNQAINAGGYVIKLSELENEVRTIGSIRANEEVQLRSEISKKVTSIRFREGGYVGKGQILFQLDASDLYAQLRKSELQEDIQIKNLDRVKILLDKGLATQEEYDVAENDLEKTRADMDLLDIQISKTSIRAPFSGIIGLRNVSIGSYVGPSDILSTIQDVNRIKVDFSVPEKYTGAIKIGDKIIFKIEGIADDFEGEVYAFEPKIEGNTRSLLIRAISNNPGRRLYPGTFANIVLQLQKTNNAIMIPTQSLIPGQQGNSVYIAKNGKAKLQKVEIGVRTDKNIQITSGLNEGDTVITTSLLRLKDNAPVIIDKLNEEQQ